MSFEEWNNNHWKVTKGMNGQYALHTPGAQYIFNEHDLLQLYHNISAAAEHIFDKEVYYIHDNDVFNRETGQQLAGVIEDCEELNRLYNENKKLETLIKEAYENERTDLGRSVLKQLANNLEIEV